MIDRDASLALADVLAGLQRQNPVYYQTLVRALQGCVDPEHLLLVSAPADSILRQQGRVAFGLDLMDVAVHADSLAAPARATPASPTTQSKDMWHG